MEEIEILYVTREIAPGYIAVRREFGRRWAVIREGHAGQWLVSEPNGGDFFGSRRAAIQWALRWGPLYPSLAAARAAEVWDT